MVEASEPEESAGELEEVQVILGLPLPADEDAAPGVPHFSCLPEIVSKLAHISSSELQHYLNG